MYEFFHVGVLGVDLEEAAIIDLLDVLYVKSILHLVLFSKVQFLSFGEMIEVLEAVDLLHAMLYHGLSGHVEEDEGGGVNVASLEEKRLR